MQVIFLKKSANALALKQRCSNRGFCPYFGWPITQDQSRQKYYDEDF